MPVALFRFDVGPGIGAGHMARCLAFADALGERGWKTVCAVNAEGLAFLPVHRQNACAIAASDATDGLGLARSLNRAFDLAIIDHYHLDAAYERNLRTCCARIIAIDDLADRPHDAEVLIDTAPGQPLDRYAARVASHTLCLLGPDYALLRSEFARGTLGGHPPIEAKAEVQTRILVSLGAVDSKNVSALVLDALSNLSAPHTVTVVLGSGAPHRIDIARRVAAHPQPARLIENATDMAGLYASHDLAIGAPGTSALERACMGLPQILIETAANQATTARGLASAAVCLGPFQQISVDRLRATVADLLADASDRSRLAVAGRNLVDGHGARRVAALVAGDIRDRAGRALSARRIRAEDSDLLFAWQTAPGTRRYFHDPSPPSRSGHEAFMQSRVARVDCFTEIVTRDGAPVALVRADPARDGYTVSIVVAPDARGQGIGFAALHYLDLLLPKADLTAVVLAANAASITAFRRAGFGDRRHRRLVIEPGNGQPHGVGLVA